MAQATSGMYGRDNQVEAFYGLMKHSTETGNSGIQSHNLDIFVLWK